MSRQTIYLLLLFGVLGSAISESLPALFEALTANNASEFADYIQTDPTAKELYLSGRLKTVFAPVNVKSPADEPDGYGKRQSPLVYQRMLYQSSTQDWSLSEMSKQVGGSIDTAANNTNNKPLDVSPTDKPTNSTSSGKRWLRPAAAGIGIASGLGQISTIIKGDIPFRDGVIHIIDR